MKEYKPAEFCVRREVVGATQGDLARTFGIKHLSVKRWESGEHVLPQDAWDWLADTEEVAAKATDAGVEALLNGLVPPASITLAYFRSAEEYEACGCEEVPYFGVANAVSRKIAQRLQEEGIECDFAYVDEETADKVAAGARDWWYEKTMPDASHPDEVESELNEGFEMDEGSELDEPCSGESHASKNAFAPVLSLLTNASGLMHFSARHRMFVGLMGEPSNWSEDDDISPFASWG